MKIEEGKYYRTRDGRKVGPMEAHHEAAMRAPQSKKDGLPLCWWTNDGKAEFDRSESGPDLIAEWVDDYPETPKRWKDLTPEEKGALLLAHHEGEVIEVRAQDSDNWYKRDSPNWADEGIFRVKPARETVTLYGEQAYYGFWGFDSGSEDPSDYRITFDLVDGEPDTDSIKMEKL